MEKGKKINGDLMLSVIPMASKGLFNVDFSRDLYCLLRFRNYQKFS